MHFRDKDKNGYLTIEELQGIVSPEVVKAASRKGDNRLTLDEYVNALFKDFAAADGTASSPSRRSTSTSAPTGGRSVSAKPRPLGSSRRASWLTPTNS
jgi:hypothetical protein